MPKPLPLPADSDDKRAAGAPTRRAVLATGAWTVPVLAVATAAPGSNASGTGGPIEPVNPLFAASCSPTEGLLLRATNNGSPLAGAQVQVTLPSGWSWSDSTTGPKTFTTNAEGIASVVGAVAGPGAATVNLIARILPSGSPVNVPVTVTGTVARQASYSPNVYNSTIVGMGGIPTDSTAVSWNTYLAPNGDLYSYNSDSGYTKVNRAAVGYPGAVTSVKGQHYSEGTGASRREVDLATFVTGTTAGTFVLQGGNSLTYSSPITVPAGTIAVGWNSFLYPSGQLFVAGTVPVGTAASPSVPATGVTSAVTRHVYNGGTGAGTTADYVSFVNASGGHSISRLGNGSVSGGSYPAVPAGSTAVGYNFFLAPDGRLFYANTVIATNVAHAAGQHAVNSAAQHSDIVTWVTTSGTGGSYLAGTGPAAPSSYSTNFGVGTKVVGYNTFLTPDEKLYYGDNLVDTGVVSADAYREIHRSGPTFDSLAWTRREACTA